MSEHAEQPPVARVRITVIRADGTIEDQGTVEAQLLPVPDSQPAESTEEGE